MLNKKVWETSRDGFKIDLNGAAIFFKLFKQLLSMDDLNKRAYLIDLFLMKILPIKCYNCILNKDSVKSPGEENFILKYNFNEIQNDILKDPDNRIEKGIVSESKIRDVNFIESNNLMDKYLFFFLKNGNKRIIFISFFEQIENKIYEKIKAFYFEFCAFIKKIETIDILNSDLEAQYEEFNSLFEQLHWFHEIADTIKSVHDINILSNEIIETVKAFYYDSLWVLIYLSDKKGLYLLSEDGFLFELNKKIRSEFKDGLLDHVFSKEISIKTGDQAFSLFSLDFLKNPDRDTSGVSKQNIMAFPLLSSKKGTAGVMVLSRKDTFTENDRNLLLKLGEYAGRSIEINRLYNEQREKDKLENDLRLANDIQQRLLPKKYPIIKNIDIYGMNIPAKSVGGDYFDVFRLEPENPDSKIAILVGDVAGKGVSAALVMAMTRSFLRAAATADSTPKEVLKRINRQILEDTQTNIYVTMFFSIYDPETMELKYSKAGHNPPYLYKKKNNEIVKLTTGGLFLGMFDDGMFEEKSIFIEEGDKLVFYTDGVTEAMNLNKEEFKSDRFVKAIEESIEFDSISSVKKIYKTVDAFVGNAPVHDDFTLMIILNKSPQHRLCAIPFDETNYYIYIERIIDDIRTVCDKRETLYTIRLCLDELITNYLRFSTPVNNEGWLNIETKITDNMVVFELYDSSSTFDMGHYYDMNEGISLFNNDHRGLIILKRLVDDISFTEKGKHIKITKLL